MYIVCSRYVLYVWSVYMVCSMCVLCVASIYLCILCSGVGRCQKVCVCGGGGGGGIQTRNLCTFGKEPI